MKALLPIGRMTVSIVSSAVLFQTPGCLDMVVANLVIGAREGLVTTVTGLIEDSFNARLGLDETNDHGDEHDEGEESANDLFVRL